MNEKTGLASGLVHIGSDITIPVGGEFGLSG